MAAVTALATCFVPHCVRMMALVNAFAPFHRPWIVIEAGRPTRWPSALCLSAAYAALQTLNLALFWFIGLANEPVIMLFLLPAWHLWAARICLLCLSETRRNACQHEESPNPSERQDSPMRSVGNRSKSNWTSKLPFFLPLQSAASTDAALLLLAAKLNDRESPWLVEAPSTTRLLAIAALVYIVGMWGDCTMLHAAGMCLVPSSLQHLGTPASNVAILVGTRASTAWMLRSDAFPSLAIISCTLRDYALERPSDEWIRHLADQWSPWMGLGGSAFSTFVLLPCGVYFLWRAKRDCKM